MIELLSYALGALSLWIAAYYSGKILINKSNSNSNIKTISIMILFSILLVLLNLISKGLIDGVLKMLIVYLLQCFFYRIMFNKNFSKCMLVALIWYLLLIASEIILGSIASIILNIMNIPLNSLKNNLIMNIMISFFNLMIIYLARRRLVTFANDNKYVEKSTITVAVIVIITITLIGYKRPITNWKFDTELVIMMAMMFCFCIIGLYLLKQRSDIQKTSSMYQEVVKYSNNTNKLLEDYRIVSHEHKNQLSIIRQMVDNNKRKELLDYIDSLINKRNQIKYKWVADLKNLPLDGLRGLINYKLLEAEENKINITVIISKEISKVRLNKLSAKQKDDLYSIVGVYLDNAIQAANECKIKEISLDIHKENKNVVLIIANTYKGNININKIDDYGYTTKGKNHGIGLHIVRKILDDNNLFSQNRKIIDNYYVQELAINTNEIKK